MHLVTYRSQQGTNLVAFVSEGNKYIKLLIMASTPRIIKVPREEARNMEKVPVSDLNNIPRFLEFTRKQHRGSTLSEEVNNILYKGEECEIFTTED